MAGNRSSTTFILETKAEAPAFRTLVRVNASSAPDTTTIFACGITPLRCRHVSSPSCVGMNRSTTMTSGWSLLAASNNAPTSVTQPTTSHDGVSSRSNAFRIPALSSASRTRGRGLLTKNSAHARRSRGSRRKGCPCDEQVGENGGQRSLQEIEPASARMITCSVAPDAANVVARVNAPPAPLSCPTCSPGGSPLTSTITPALN